MKTKEEFFEKLRSRPVKEAEVEYEGVKFRLRALRSASELANIFQKIRMLPPRLKYRLADGREVEVHRDVASAIIWIKATLVEPALTEEELVELSEYTEGFIFVLLQKAIELCEFGRLSELEDFFEKPQRGNSGEE